MISKIFFKFILVIYLLLPIKSLSQIISQNPKDTFESGAFPRQLELIRSQTRELSQKDKDTIYERSKNDQMRNDLLRVAVIDSGVDIAHPDLISQIEYRIEEGKLKGAGYDIMGQGPSASHVYVDPTLFAFGAEDVREGKIINPNQSPLHLLKSVNDRFTELLLSSIHNDQLLKQSLFKNLTKDNVNILSFYPLKFSFSKILKAYHDNLKNHLVFGPDDINKSLIPSELKDGWIIKFADPLFSLPALNAIHKIQHSDRLINILTMVLNKIDAEFLLNKNIKQVHYFLESHGLNKNEKSAFSVIGNAMKFVVWGPSAFDPLLILENLMVTNKELQGLKLENAFKDLTEQIRKQTLIAIEQNTELSKKGRSILESDLAELDRLAQLGSTLDQIKSDPKKYNELRSKMRRFTYRTHHPYLDLSGNKNLHGTHVAGIIAKQNKNIRIIPFRMMTGASLYSDERNFEIIEKVALNFSEWVKLPIIQELIRQMLADEYPELKISPDTFDSELLSYLKNKSSLITFFNELLITINKVGYEKIKIANISLGGSSISDIQQSQRSFLNDLLSEFMRYELGTTIQKNASKTLFIIALGNDSGWIDGVTKSIFPAGITSPRLYKIANELKIKHVPNNAIKNVLAVSSISTTGKTSSFTNIILDPLLPQIFSTGENIMSPVPRKDTSFSEPILQKELKVNNILPFLTHHYKIKPNEQQQNLGNTNRWEAILLTQSLVSLSVNLTNMVHAQGPIDRAPLSGTSMAAPTVTGVIADFIISKMAKDNIPMDHVYFHPSLRPGALINQVQGLSKTNSMPSIITVKMLVDGIKTWTQSDNQKKAQLTAKQLFNPQTKMCSQVLLTP